MFYQNKKEEKPFKNKYIGGQQGAFIEATQRPSIKAYAKKSITI